MNIATIAVSGVYARVKEHTSIPAGIVGGTVTFHFTEGLWQNLRKTVIFKGNVTRDVIMEGNQAVIPFETVAKAEGCLKVGIYGVDADNNLAVPTLWTTVGRIRCAADPSGDPGADPSLPIWAQLQARVADLEENGTGTGGSGGVDFETGDTLKLEDGMLNVNTTSRVEEGNQLPITSAGVYAAVGNIETLLNTI